MAHEELIMIPTEIVTFLEGACVGFAGTRDRNLVPYVHRVTAWRVGPDRQTMTCMISKPFLKNLLSSLEENGEFAVTVSGSTSGVHRSNPPRPATDAHETYQFKGKYIAT